MIPYAFLSGVPGIALSAALSALGLFISGAVITVMTGRHPVFSGVRQVLVGLACAAITFGVGKIIGVAVG